MRKLLLITLLLLFTFSTHAFAKPSSDDIAIANQLATKLNTENSNMDPESIRVLASTTFQAQIKDNNNNIVTVPVRALFVEYNFINDTLFVKSHKDIYFYDETNKTFSDATATTYDTIPVAKQFKDQYQSEIGTDVHYIGPLLILAALGMAVFFVIRYAERNFYLSTSTKKA